MTRIAICVPWRPGDRSRERLWEELRPHYEAIGLPIYEGDSDPSRPFSRPAARNAAARAAGRKVDVYFFVDADVYIPVDQLFAAANRAHETGGACLPYEHIDQVHPVTLLVSPRVSSGTNVLIRNSSNIAVSRRLWRKMHGWDERFPNWGFEDGAFIGAARMLAPFDMIEDARIITFNHTRKVDENFTEETMRLPPVLLEYRAARTPKAMQAVMDRAYKARGTIDVRDQPAK
jgi:hypothetical protein